MATALEWLRSTHGDAAGYLVAAGVDPATIEALRARLVEPAPAG